MNELVNAVELKVEGKMKIIKKILFFVWLFLDSENCLRCNFSQEQIEEMGIKF